MLKFTKFSTAAERSTENLISTPEAESQAAKWFKLNEMIVNPVKFQAIHCTIIVTKMLKWKILIHWILMT